MASFMTVVQLAGLAAVLTGVALALPLAVALMVGGLILVLVGTLGEYIVTSAPSGPPARREQRNGSGVA